MRRWPVFGLCLSLCALAFAGGANRGEHAAAAVPAVSAIDAGVADTWRGFAVRDMDEAEKRVAAARTAPVVVRVDAKVAAEGLLPGDLVVAVNGQAVHSARELQDALDAIADGAMLMRLTVVRGGHERLLTLWR